jgi:hypothetical protein
MIVTVFLNDNKKYTLYESMRWDTMVAKLHVRLISYQKHELGIQLQ